MLKTDMAKAARRQHFIARFYLRNFAEPILSDNLHYYDIRKGRWEKRSPDGIGWFPHLCSMFDMEGNRTDDFDQFLKKKVEDPAVPALKKLATQRTLFVSDRAPIALFIALTAARAPKMMNNVVQDYLRDLGHSERTELDNLVKLWCIWTKKEYKEQSHIDFLKPGSFGAIWIWSQSFQRRLLRWDWNLVHTTREQPFVTSDQPVYAVWDRNQDVRLVSFPISSEVGLIVAAGGQFNEKRDRTNEGRAMNRQTMDSATDFVVACKESFPGDDFLIKRTETLKSQLNQPGFI